MKKILFCVAIILSMKISFGQSVWFPNGATWYEGYADFSAQGYIKHLIVGDTIIGSIIWKKIEVMSVISHLYQGNIDTSFYEELVYESGNIVYVPNLTNGSDTLCNFNASPGDSWLLYEGCPCPSDAYILVADTGSKIVNGHHRKIMILNYHNTVFDNFSDTLIEGIGSLSFVLFYQSLCMTDPKIFFCSYQDQEIGLYPDHALHCDTIFMLGIESPPHTSQQIIFKNPVDDQLYISGNNFQNTTLEIFDATGRSVMKLSETRNTIDISNLTPGIYFLTIKTPKKTLQGKFVKQ